MKPTQAETGSQANQGLTLFSPERIAEQPGSAPNEVQLAVKDGVIAKVGDPREMREWLKGQESNENQTVTRKEIGGVLLPGLTDAHDHPALFATLLDVIKPAFLFGIESKKEVLEALKKRAAECAEGEPVVALGLNTVKVGDLTAKDIESAIGSRPVLVIDPSFHGGVATDSMAKMVRERAMGFEQKHHRELSGYIKNDGRISEEYLIQALELVEAGQSIEKVIDATEGRLEGLLRKGVTAVHDLMPLTTNQFIATLLLKKKWEKERPIDFPVRKIYLRPHQLEEVVSRMPDLEREGLLNPEMLGKMVGIKLLADGSFGSYTAGLSDEYINQQTKGLFFDKVEDMNRAMDLAQRHGVFSIAMHAIGDSAIRRAIDCARDWIRMGEEKNFTPNFRIEHFELPLPVEKTLKDVKDLGIWVTPQPNFLLDYVYEDRLGDRVQWLCPHQKITEFGIPMMFGTDSMPESMLYAMYLATHAKEPEQRLTMEQALVASSLTASHFEGDNRGSLREGKKADIIVADPALLPKLSPGAPDVNHDEQDARVKELEGMIQRVYQNGMLIDSKR